VVHSVAACAIAEHWHGKISNILHAIRSMKFLFFGALMHVQSFVQATLVVRSYLKVVRHHSGNVFIVVVVVVVIGIVVVVLVGSGSLM